MPSSDTAYGLGDHLEYLETVHPQDLLTIFELIWVFSLCYYISTSIAKLSIAIMMLRIFPQRWFRIFVISEMVFITISCITSIAVSFAVKWFPNWSFEEYHRKIAIDATFNYVFSALNAAFDVSLATVPVPLVWQLQMPTRERIPVIALFGVGLLSCVASFVRLGTFHDVLGADATFSSGTCFTWTQIEGSMAVICAIVPVLKPLFNRVLGIGTRFDNNHSSDQRSGFTRKSMRDQFSVNRYSGHELKFAPTGTTRGACYPALDDFDDDLMPKDAVQVKTEYNVVTHFENDSASEKDLATLDTPSPRVVEEGTKTVDFTKPADSVWR